MQILLDLGTHTVSGMEDEVVKSYREILLDFLLSKAAWKSAVWLSYLDFPGIFIATWKSYLDFHVSIVTWKSSKVHFSFITEELNAVYCMFLSVNKLTWQKKWIFYVYNTPKK
jgi:hypothetical protein